jgi:D-serine deaminase-like pyridoxal phosphate-dependent protein
VASENPIDLRVAFPGIENVTFAGHSEEHLVVKVSDANEFKVGQELYGFPYHICPTVALYEKAHVIENNSFTSTWRVIARDRMIRH